MCLRMNSAYSLTLWICTRSRPSKFGLNGKDLLEATAAHILTERNGSDPKTNFQGLLGQAFVALGMTIPQHPVVPGEPPQKRIERAMFELACAVNSLRNKAGTGHGRPWLPSVSDAEAKAAIEFMGIVAEWMLDVHGI